jgi:hypothetical protein
MGGLAGHLQHVYEDIGLTFGELKEILRDASTGRLESVTEKLDGQNIFFGYRDGSLRFARNLGDLRRGGMVKDEVDRKWIDKPSVQSAFSQAYLVLSKAVDGVMSPDEKREVFGERGEYWFSAEILSVANPNVILYGQNVISPHLFGARKFNELTGHLEDNSEEGVFEKLLGFAAKLDAEMTESNWQLSAPVVYPLVKLGSQQPLKKALASIDQIMAEVGGMTDASSVGDYIKAKLGYYVKPYGIGADVVDELGKRMVGDTDKVARINSLRKYATDEEQYIRIVALDRNKRKIFKTITKPIEDVITKFASELLEGSKSMLVVDHSAAADRIKLDLSMAIEKIRSSPDALAALGDQLNKLQGADKITSTIEGIVFRRAGKSYKFTGQFAPINQLIGALKFGGRGYDDEEGFVLRRKPNADQTVTIFPGAFKPFHRGHDRVVRLASLQSDKVLLIVSDGDREKPGEVPVLGETMKAVWDRYIKPTLPANVTVEYTDNPVTRTYELLSLYDKSNSSNTQINLLAGDEDIARFKPEAVANDAPRLYQIGLVDIQSVPRFGNVSGTDMRSFIALGDKAKFVSGLSDQLRDVGGEIFDYLRNSGLKRVKELVAAQKIQQQLRPAPKGKKPALEIFSQGTSTAKNKTTMATDKKPQTKPVSVKMNMKDLAKLVKESLKESLAEASGGPGDDRDARARVGISKLLQNYLTKDVFGVTDFNNRVLSHPPVAAQSGPAFQKLTQFCQRVTQNLKSNPLGPDVFPLADKPELVKMIKDAIAELGQAPPAAAAGSTGPVKEDAGAAMADDAAAADEEMVMEAIAAAYKAGLKKGREQQKQLHEQARAKAAAGKTPAKK